MKRFLYISLIFCLLLTLCACGGKTESLPTATPAPTPESAGETPAPTATPAPTPEPTPSAYTPSELDWQSAYRRFVEDNFDVFAALWPEGMSGVGFIDLDLDGLPEMLLFDMGASASMGVQIFDIVEGAVVCVSSVNEAAAAAFGGEWFAPLAVCACFFEDFRLLESGDESFFSVRSTNGSLESCWEEQLRFGCGESGELTLASLFRLETESDVENGIIAAEYFFAAGEPVDEASYTAAAAAMGEAYDTGYEAAGMFLWNDMERYDTSIEGLLAMLDDAAAVYAPPM